jgi:hypothetical protein
MTHLPDDSSVRATGFLKKRRMRRGWKSASR